jgi:hypothetical protein
VGLELGARPGVGGSITIGDKSIPDLGAGDRFDVSIKFPSATPYLGLGYGHHAGKGLGFHADLGVSVGRTKLTATASGPNLSTAVSKTDIDRELAQLRDGVGKVRALPQVSFGLNYRF